MAQKMKAKEVRERMRLCDNLPSNQNRKSLGILKEIYKNWNDDTNNCGYKMYFQIKRQLVKEKKIKLTENVMYDVYDDYLLIDVYQNHNMFLKKRSFKWYPTQDFLNQLPL